MSSLFRQLILACLVLVLACTAQVEAAPPGFLEGHLRVVSSKEVDLADGDAAGITAEAYAEYPLVVWSADGEKEITRVKVDGEGSYRTSLPPGDYVLDVQDRTHRHVRASPKKFSIISRETARVDMEIDTGVR